LQRITARCEGGTGTFDTAGACENQTIPYPCPATAQLPFFGFQELVISIIGIFAVYLLAKKNL
jgi:hypothetical protein